MTAKSPPPENPRQSGHHGSPIVYNGNVTEAVRATVGQLLHYRHLFHPADQDIRMVAVFTESIGDACAGFLETLGIRSIWRNGDTWGGSPTAYTDGLCPATDYPVTHL